MIGSQDDLLGHRSVEHRSDIPAREVKPMLADTPHAVFTERFWYMGALVPQGDFVFGAGLGHYPNRGITDGYVGVSIDGIQYNVRASRRSAADPLGTHVGPIRITVLQALQTHRIELQSNDSGLSLDLQFTASLPPNDEGRDRVTRDGEVVADVLRYVQFGHYIGWVSINGRRVEISDRDCWGARDRSWGLRTEARADESTPPVTRFRPMIFLWVCAQFEDHGIHIFLKEDAPGRVRSLVANETYPSSTGRPTRNIVRVEHELEWQDDEFAQRLRGGALHLTFADGERKVLNMIARSGWFSLKAGMYGGYEGWFQGDDKGPLLIASDVWDHSDPGLRRQLRTLADQAIEFSDGRRVGYGTIQGGVAEGYPKYQQIQRQPMM